MSIPPPRTFTLTLTGDVMLGRLIDQLLPHPIPNPPPSEALHSPFSSTLLSLLHTRYPHLQNYTSRSPWGSTLPLLHASDLTLINLETAVTTRDTPWPGKTFNYRMNPANLAALKEARVDYASLANNHAADFGEQGLVDTVRAVRDEAGVSVAGAGEVPDAPAVLDIPRVKSEERGRGEGGEGGEGCGKSYKVHVYSASDHPRDWASLPTFHFIDYTSSTRERLKKALLEPKTFQGSASQSTGGIHTHTPAGPSRPDLKIFSVHWGPNYAWHPSDEIQSLAHFLVDECAVDIVVGHSAHHVQGVETYHGKLIIYGCGDFVDDYAVNGVFRNDLGAVWRAVVKEAEGEEGLVLDRLEVFPTRCQFQANLLDSSDEDHEWVVETVSRLSREMGTSVREELGKEGQVVVHL